MSDLISRKALCEFCLNTKDRTIDANDIMRFPSAEPERNIIRCAGCKWWDQLEDGHPYGYCRACRSGTHTDRWDISIQRQCKFDFFCADAELKDNDGVTNED